MFNLGRQGEIGFIIVKLPTSDLSTFWIFMVKVCQNFGFKAKICQFEQ